MWNRPRGRSYRRWLSALTALLLVFAMAGPGLGALAFAEDGSTEGASGPAVETPAPEKAAEQPKEEPKEEPKEAPKEAPKEEPAAPEPPAIEPAATTEAPVEPVVQVGVASAGLSGGVPECETPPETGSISGHKFKDGTESGISGVKFKIKLLKKDGSGHYVEVASTWSSDDGSGDWSFTGLANGKYQVEEDPGTWVQVHVPTYPGGKDYVEIKDSQKSITCLNFYNKPKTGSLELTKYKDTNGDEKKDVVFAGVTFTLTGPDKFSSSKKTDDHGKIEWKDLVPGDYVLTETEPNGYYAVGGKTADVKVVADDCKKVEVCNALLQKVEIHKYNDLDNSGHQDGGEPHMANRWFTLDGPDDFTARGKTDSNGYLCFEGLKPGHYTLTEDTYPGWRGWSDSFTLAAGSGSSSTIVGGDCGDGGSGEPKVRKFDVPNLEWAKVTVNKYHDLNANGDRDSGEPAMDMEFELTGPHGYHKHLTTSGGTAVFDQLVPGSYTLKEIVTGDWHAEPLQQSFTLAAGGSEVRYVGNYKHAKVEVSKYNDPNDDGSQTIPQKDITFRLTNTETQQFYTDETDSEGKVEFENLMPGTYELREIGMTGWFTKPALPQTFTLVSGQCWTGSFCNTEYGKVIVKKFDDLNGDKQKDPNEPWLAQEFTLTGPSGKAWFDTKLGTTAASDAGFTFEDLRPGTYQLSEILPADMFETTGLMNEDFTVAAGETKIITVGNTHYATVEINKFEDANGNNEWDEGEQALERTFHLNGPDGTLDGTTDPDTGKLTFSNLKPGTYTLTEDAEDHWYASFGLPTESFTLSGGEVKVFDIANRRIIHKGWELTFPGHPTNATYRVDYQVGKDPMKSVALDSDLKGSVEVTAVANIVSWSWIASIGGQDYVLGTGSKESISQDTTNTFEYGASVSGIKFRDMNKNGVKDAGDPPLGGWTIQLYMSGVESELKLAAGEVTPTVPSGFVLVGSTDTAADGSYSFSGLLPAPAQYFLAEVAQDGWTRTLSPAGPFTVSNSDVLTGRDFGNWIPFLGFTDPDLGILKTVDRTKALPGEELVYTIKYFNIGEGSAVNFVVTDTFDPSQLEVVDAAGGTVTSGKITWNIVGPLAPAGSSILTVRMRVKAGLAEGTVIKNTATVLISELADPTMGDNSSVVSVVIDGEPFLPFTGADLWLLLLAACVFGIAGLTLRRLALRRA
jgi:uncharacterized repeat protein (TIGR01451 family)